MTPPVAKAEAPRPQVLSISSNGASTALRSPTLRSPTLGSPTLGSPTLGSPIGSPMLGSPTPDSYPGVSKSPRLRDDNRRPDQRLRLVVQTPRKRTSPILLLTAATVIVALFGLAAFHNLMATAQYDLEHVERELELEQARLVNLEFQIESLNSPGSIEQLARGALGMIDPDRAVDLAVQPTLLAEVQGAAGPPAAAQNLGADWATVKPFLGTS